MTFGAYTPDDLMSRDPLERRRTPVSQTLLCALALAATTAAGLWLLYAGPAEEAAKPLPVRMAQAQQLAGPIAVPLAPVVPPKPRPSIVPPPPQSDPTFFDPAFTAGYNPLTFARSAPLHAAFARPPVPVEAELDTQATGSLPDMTREAALAAPLPALSEPSAVPLPVARPEALIVPAPERLAQREVPAAAPARPPAQPSFFDRLFHPAPAGGQVLAYAAPEDGGLGGVLGRSFPYDRWTAVYVIATHTVYLPDGTVLEAHSGLGSRLDDPRSVTERMRGATPPAVYDLSLREQPFHGVRALRLNPSDPSATFGRGGLLAHTYMLGPRGDSNGCVVFRNYQAFLHAYESGDIRRLAVVARMN